MTSLVFTIPGKPVPKQRARKGAHGWYTPNETRRYEATVAAHALKARQEYRHPRGCLPRDPWPLDAVYEVEVLCVWADRRRRDIDNAGKSVLDGAIGVLFNDDSQVRKLTLMRGEPERATRTVVRITAIDEEGHPLVSMDPTEPFQQVGR